ncbi:twin-arginine translocation signal domain-containing protein [Halieaceae bacterium IMCC14734]|uniref:Twin-arginine translocation signal domain-containing protein n=1 Tax=Candidatus Litorirhabdus singularis TaxID=2518993 RepID=A0ABT3TBL4_9GAMM|nr:twin-arginine translocation signal domain-containing protein [Candidatus Litorirhabdus singularis]MCX2979590.1 twin-arginine translocation signal domain-containing protein [Candidatus Litorirhabdus singularis]
MKPITRRQLLQTSAALVAAAALPRLASAYQVSAAGKAALAESPLVYISPLKSDGEESRCHGEVWFFVDGGDVIICSETTTWKATAQRQGLQQARIWVGDYGPVWRSLGRYRNAPEFLAQVSVDSAPATYQRLMTSFAERYPEEWPGWEERFMEQYAAGTRVILRYRPVGD